MLQPLAITDVTPEQIENARRYCTLQNHKGVYDDDMGIIHGIDWRAVYHVHSSGTLFVKLVREPAVLGGRSEEEKAAMVRAAVRRALDAPPEMGGYSNVIGKIKNECEGVSITYSDQTPYDGTTIIIQNTNFPYDKELDAFAASSRPAALGVPAAGKVSYTLTDGTVLTLTFHLLTGNVFYSFNAGLSGPHAYLYQAKVDAGKVEEKSNCAWVWTCTATISKPEG